MVNLENILFYTLQDFSMKSDFLKHVNLILMIWIFVFYFCCYLNNSVYHLQGDDRTSGWIPNREVDRRWENSDVRPLRPNAKTLYTWLKPNQYATTTDKLDYVGILFTEYYLRPRFHRDWCFRRCQWAFINKFATWFLTECPKHEIQRIRWHFDITSV